MDNEEFENISVDNEVIKEKDEIIENSENDEQTSDMLAYDYYDNYYNHVMTSLDNIQTQQNTIIDNQQIIIACNQGHNTSFSVISFFLGLIFVFIFIKSIIK